MCTQGNTGHTGTTQVKDHYITIATSTDDHVTIWMEYLCNYRDRDLNYYYLDMMLNDGTLRRPFPYHIIDRRMCFTFSKQFPLIDIEEM